MEVKEKKGGGGREKRPFVRNDVFGCATDMVLCFDASLESSYDLARQKNLGGQRMMRQGMHLISFR